MQIAYLLYDRFTALDLVGPHDVLNNIPGTESVIVAERCRTGRVLEAVCEKFDMQ